jgi:hypothetical protein
MAASMAIPTLETTLFFRDSTLVQEVLLGSVTRDWAKSTTTASTQSRMPLQDLDVCKKLHRIDKCRRTGGELIIFGARITDEHVMVRVHLVINFSHSTAL